jgi:single-strand DNA-binding protein
MADLRMPDTNIVIIAGRLTRDPELRFTNTNRAYCKLGIAATKKYKTKGGEAREETTFVDGTVWDKAAEYCGEHMRKGQAVMLEGSLKTNSWEQQDGQKRSKLELALTRVQSLEWGDSKPQSQSTKTADEPKDDIPF